MKQNLYQNPLTPFLSSSIIISIDDENNVDKIKRERMDEFTVNRTVTFSYRENREEAKKYIRGGKKTLKSAVMQSA